MNIYKKLLEVKKAVPYLKKDKKGYNYEYTSPEALFGQINPILNAQGLLLMMLVLDAKSYPIKVPTKNNPNAEEWKYDLELMMKWVDSEDGETIEIPWKSSGVNGEDKGLGSALTYAERYFVMKQFQIPTGEDDPDSFQEKNMSKDDKVKRDNEAKQASAELMAVACAEMRAVTSMDGIKPVWDKYPDFAKKGTEFTAAKDEMKNKFAGTASTNTPPAAQQAPPADTTQVTPPAATWQMSAEVQQELEKLLANTTLTEKGRTAAATKIAQAKSDEDVDAARKGLLSKQKPAAPDNDKAPF